jgi:hypothetical protein
MSKLLHFLNQWASPFLCGPLGSLWNTPKGLSWETFLCSLHLCQTTNFQRSCAQRESGVTLIPYRVQEGERVEFQVRFLARKDRQSLMGVLRRESSSWEPLPTVWVSTCGGCTRPLPLRMVLFPLCTVMHRTCCWTGEKEGYGEGNTVLFQPLASGRPPASALPAPGPCVPSSLAPEIPPAGGQKDQPCLVRLNILTCDFVDQLLHIWGILGECPGLGKPSPEGDWESA